MTVRTRIAPSPTGDPHVGTAYIALFNLCFARQHGGQFILRVEDTDQVRSTAESEQMILDSLRWLGLDWDEGPDVGGPHGPYRQSERLAIYQDHAAKLLADGHAFYCFATAQELDDMRREQMARSETPRYDGRGLLLTQEEVRSRLESGTPHVIRMKVPEQGVCIINDRLRGEIEIPWQQVDMQVLLKADGMPTYHLANVVDDHLMGITHVIRGEEWINSAPKHKLLYQYFGWEMPEMCHMPLLRNPDKSKLSKRKNPTSINFYKAMGYMPEGMLNYLGRMGWSMPDEAEKFTLEQMIANFNLDNVHLGGPVFDREKLDWLNGCWIRENLDADQFADRVADWALNRDNLKRIIPLIKERVEKFSDIAPLTGFLFSGMPAISAESFAHNKLDGETVQKILQFSSWRLDTLRTWARDDLYAELNQIAGQMGIKLKDFLAPLFVAVAGSSSAPPLFDAMAILGADMVRARVRHGLDIAGAPSKKQLKNLEREYQQISAERLSNPAEEG
ncbi:MAG: glutamyl-tRNA synthetase [Gammaproteobacteria bacterium BRH_c0]|nr:MAG: glutamyl-tRNA synthetase [Gammaproteobacteria bacterium BRH_c0]